MNEILSTLLNFLPSKRKATPSGWTSFDAVCCHNRGESRDTKKRGGILLNQTDGFQYHCFNCGFKAGWTPGKSISNNTKNLFKWLGVNNDLMNRLIFIALSSKEQLPKSKNIISFDLEERQLPELSRPLQEWCMEDPVPDRIIEIIDYVTKHRGMDFSWYDWYYSPSPGYADRVIIPYFSKGKIVGCTARKITEGKPKYITDTQPGYVFNLDSQTEDKSIVIVVEGQFDAIAIEGCAIMHNDPNDAQCERIRSLNKEVILVPDRDRAGAKIINSAIKNQWAISIPLWESHIKDVADAVKHYGRLYTLATILAYKETNPYKQELIKKQLENANK